ncbi:MAG TPA: DUF3455 domain-containing protein [Polyangiaceae bacterium]|nr:DUF3455 domain-containing protein [Polyangiaceae bacterium]
MIKWGLRAAVVASSVGVSLLAQACSGGGDNPDASSDASQDVTSNPDSSKPDSSTTDSGGGDASGGDASDAGCPSSWTAAPTVPPALAIPDGGTTVIIHAAGVGTQDYTCEQVTTDAGSSYKWVFVGPEAELRDCNANVIGHHFASDGGAAAPEWMTIDNAYIIGAKSAAYTPDGGASSVPWLLLQTTSSGGTGPITATEWVHRLDTDGGVAPTSTCDSQSSGTTQKVGYTADYYFYGP